MTSAMNPPTTYRTINQDGCGTDANPHAWETYAGDGLYVACEHCGQRYAWEDVCGTERHPHQWLRTPWAGDTCVRCGQLYECCGMAFHEVRAEARA